MALAASCAGYSSVIGCLLRQSISPPADPFGAGGIALSTASLPLGVLDGAGSWDGPLHARLQPLADGLG